VVAEQRRFARFFVTLRAIIKAPKRLLLWFFQKLINSEPSSSLAVIAPSSFPFHYEKISLEIKIYG